MLIKELLEGINLENLDNLENTVDDTLNELNTMISLNVDDRVRHSTLMNPNNPKGLGTVKIKQGAKVWVLPDDQPLPLLPGSTRIDQDKLKHYDQGQLIPINVTGSGTSSLSPKRPPQSSVPSRPGQPLTRGAIRQAQQAKRI
jgi:hypothetical protein